MNKKVLSVVAASALSLGLIGCGGGGSSSSNGSTSTTVSGTAVDELIADGIVKIHKDSLKGDVLATVRTKSDGSYSVTIPYKGPIVIEITCDSKSRFIEDNGTKQVCSLPSPLLSANIADGSKIAGNVSPFTTQMVQTALSNSNKLTSTSLQKEKKVIAYIFGIDPVIANPQKNTTYKTIIDILHTLAKDNKEHVLTLNKKIIADLQDNKFGDDPISKKILQMLKNKKINSPAIINNDTTINIKQIENSSTPYDGIIATKMVINSLRDNLYSISNKDKNASIDNEIKSFNTSINKDVVKNTRNDIAVLGYIISAAVSSNSPMSGSIHINNNQYDYKVVASNNNTQFDYTISWNNKDYKGVVTTSQDYKAVNDISDLKNSMDLKINGALPSTDNKTISAIANGHRNNDKTFSFTLSDVKIKGDSNSLEIKNVEIDGKYFEYTDDNNNNDGDLDYVRFNNIEINSKIDNKFEINGTLAVNWTQNSYIANTYPKGGFDKLQWLKTYISCVDKNGAEKRAEGGKMLFKFNGKTYPLNPINDGNDLNFGSGFNGEIMLHESKNGDLDDYVHNYDNYDLSQVKCPTGYSAKIDGVSADIDGDYQNDGYIPNKITFTGSLKDVSTNVELDGKLSITSNDINQIDFTKDGDINPDVHISLNAILKRPEYKDTILNLDTDYYQNKSSKLYMTYNYGDDMITISSNWKSDKSGTTTITDLNGVKIVLPVNTEGDIEYDKTNVLFNGKKVGDIEDRGNNLPVVHFTSGDTVSIN